jgi:regulatory protein
LPALPLEKARDYAFLLLKFRPRSEKEICLRLKRKKFDPEVIQKTLSFLIEKGFLDDHYFAKAWIESRLRRPFGLRRIRQELKEKGIRQEIIDRQVEEVSKDYCEEEVVLKVAKARLNSLKGIEPQKKKNRLYGYLLRRGFSPEEIIEVVNRLCKQTH